MSDRDGIFKISSPANRYMAPPRVRTEPSKPSNVLEFVFSVQVPSIVLEFNSMFSNVLETKCLENAIILAVYWRKELNKFAHPTTSGKKGATRTAAERMLGSRRPRVTRAEVAPKRKWPMAASDINYPSAVFSSTETRLPMTCAFVSHFRPCCVRWICVEFYCISTRLDIHYASRV